MIQYAVADCTAVTKLYFMIYPSNSSIRTSYETPTTASTNITLNIDNLSDISNDEEPQILMPRFDKEPQILMPRFDKEPQILMPKFDEEPRILMPYFDKPPQILISKFDEQNYLTIETTEEEMNEFNAQEQTTTTRLSKSEKQRKKNMKAQLCDDNIYTSHKIRINRKYNEVIIGFKSRQQLECARNIMKINYFSKNQYIERWG
ncbi:unnamed protein product, partial [Rotaria sp. Silwood1]